MPPPVVDVDFQRNDADDRGDDAPKRQQAEAQARVPQRAGGSLDRSRNDRCGANRPQRQGERRTRDGEPDGEVLDGEIHASVKRPAEQFKNDDRELGQDRPPLDGAPNRVAPQIRQQREDGHRARQRERARRDENPLALRPSLREGEIQRPQGRNRREQNQPYNAKVDENPDRRAKQSERG